MFHHPGCHYIKLIAGLGDRLINKETSSQDHPERSETKGEVEANYIGFCFPLIKISLHRALSLSHFQVAHISLYLKER